MDFLLRYASQRRSQLLLASLGLVIAVTKVRLRILANLGLKSRGGIGRAARGGHLRLAEPCRTAISTSMTCIACITGLA